MEPLPAIEPRDTELADSTLPASGFTVPDATGSVGDVPLAFWRSTVGILVH